MERSESDLRRIHDDLIVVDGAAPMVSWGMDPAGNIADSSGKGFNYYIEGGVTAAPATMSTTRLNMEITQKAIGFFDKIIEKRGFLKIRTAADVKRAKREKKFGTWYHM